MTNPSPPFRKILVANRGEIAVRVMRACRELGIKTVGVYSEADIQALHVRMADEVVPIGAAPAGESYLVGRKLIAAALQTGAEAIHPGYGFLAENAEFARAVMDAGLVFIGPDPAAMEAMGDKARARALVQTAGVPVVPGYQGPDGEPELAEAAEALGYPVLVKAAAGGGGKGMRLVWHAKELPDALAGARREAANAFGETRLIVEKYVAGARHVEFQVLGDRHGNLVHLNERECSIQRRHQKIIEETPAPGLGAGMRAEMGTAAVAAARAVGYHNAGTVEFIVDPPANRFYFLEMNTRLQVEHPITELTTGLDLVQWQIRVAAGEPLSFNQGDIRPRGHALECRLYAEDPANGFLPATGELLLFIPPAGPGVRVDSGVTTGDHITVHYDPLVAKVSACAADRPGAIRKMQAALREMVVLGLTTNQEFLQAVLAHPVFLAGEANTEFIGHHLPDWQPEMGYLPLEVLAAALSAELGGGGSSDLGTQPAAPYSPWNQSNGFRIGGR